VTFTFDLSISSQCTPSACYGPTLVSPSSDYTIAQAVFLSEPEQTDRQTDRHTDATDHPNQASALQTRALVMIVVRRII